MADVVRHTDCRALDAVAASADPAEAARSGRAEELLREAAEGSAERARKMTDGEPTGTADLAGNPSKARRKAGSADASASDARVREAPPPPARALIGAARLAKEAAVDSADEDGETRDAATAAEASGRLGGIPRRACSQRAVESAGTASGRGLGRQPKPAKAQGALRGRMWAKSRAAAASSAPSRIATARAGTAKTVGAALASAAAPLAGAALAVIAFAILALTVSQLASALFGFWSAEAAKRSVEGLPPYVTYQMVEAALECQEEYGDPAGCTIAQIIVESGQGETMSRLATRDCNLFGIKWSPGYASCPEVTGHASWVTGEHYGGEDVVVTASFATFASDVDCIRFRSRVMLRRPPYSTNETIAAAVASTDSRLMAEGLKDAGWATSPDYVAALHAAMDAYNLDRFDSMTAEDLRGMRESGDAIVRAAYTQLGVDYVWGGMSPGVGLDCSGLTQYCYAQAGISIPRHSEAQRDAGTAVPLSQARPGDILWRRGHVAIFIGGDSYIHAPQTGDVVRVAHGISAFTCAVSFR